MFEPLLYFHTILIFNHSSCVNELWVLKSRDFHLFLADLLYCLKLNCHCLGKLQIVIKINIQQFFYLIVPCKLQHLGYQAVPRVIFIFWGDLHIESMKNILICALKIWRYTVFIHFISFQ